MPSIASKLRTSPAYRMTRRIRGLVVLIGLACLGLAVPAAAQTHPCDLPQPTSGTAVAGAPITIQGCAGPMDVNGNPVNPTGFALYDNGVRTTPAFVFGTQAPVSGFFVVTVAATAPTTGGVHTYQLAEFNAVGEGAKSPPFVLTVSLPPGVPVAPTKLIVK